MKLCGECKIEKEECCFNKQSSKKDGLYSFCKECAKIKSALYNKENKANISTTKKLYYIEHAVEILEKRRLHREDNLDKFKLKDKLYYQNNTKVIKSRNKQYALKHRDEIVMYKIQWDKANTEKILAYKQRYYETFPENLTERNKFRDFFSPTIRKRDEYQCKVCRQSNSYLEVHHISPWKLDIANRFNELNCITLCLACHKKAHNNGNWKTIDTDFALTLQSLLTQ